jgi:hypothetical protein
MMNDPMMNDPMMSARGSLNLASMSEPDRYMP